MSMMRFWSGAGGLMILHATLAVDAACQPQPSFDPGNAIWSVRQAYFAGDHARAIRAGEALIARPEVAGPHYRDLRCDALLHVFAAQWRAGDRAAAAGTYERFLQATAPMPRTHELLVRMAAFRTAVGAPVDALRVADRPTFVPPADPEWSPIPTDRLSDVVDVAVLEGLATRSRAAGHDGLLVIVDGRIALERYASTYRGEMMTMSSMKSFLALLVGLAIEDGRIQGVDAPIGRWLPSWRDGARGRVTLAHLLGMTSGLRRMRTGGVTSAKDTFEYVLGLTPIDPPGSAWHYSNEGVQLLGAALQAAVEEPLPAYAKRRLFGPAGMRATSLRTDRVGNPICYADARTTLRDFARLGIVLAASGTWRGREVVPKRWLGDCVRPGLRPNYGYLFWLHGEDCFAMEGYLSTNLWILPGAGVVVARTQSRPSLTSPKGLDERAFVRDLRALRRRP